jgi:hypothetical protein
MLSELPIPPAVRSDKNAQEMIRAWIAHQELHCSLNVETKQDDEKVLWGILLTDVVRHVADALHASRGWDRSETIAEIRRIFNAELDDPTASPTGQFHTH